VRIVRFAVFACCVVLVSATPFSVHGQEEPLPAVVRKTPATLAEAADRNDYPGFAALYEARKTSGDNVDAWTPLYDLWTWSLSDPNGAFYGRDRYERLAQAYPTFADTISAHAIVDADGNTSWPTAETRAFLLERARAGEPVETPLPNVKPRREAPKPKTAVVVLPVPAARAAPPMEQPEDAPPPPAAAPELPASAKPWTSGVFMLVLLGMFAVGTFAILTRVGGARGNESPGSDEPRQHSPSSPDRSLRDGDARGRRQ